jgi:hypothetical protein
VTPREALDDHVARFDRGVRIGDFTAMFERFTDDAEMVFEGVPVGPFHGREAIAAAYREQPPDDELLIIDVPEISDREVVARYAWARDPHTVAGELRLQRRGDLIERLVVTFVAGSSA